MRQMLARALLLALLIATTAYGVASAQAPGPGGRPGPPGGPPFGEFPPGPPGLRPGLHFPPPEAFDALDLSDAQRDRIDALRDKVRRASIRLEADIRLAEMDARKSSRATGRPSASWTTR